MPQPRARQLELSKESSDRLIHRIEEDYSNDSADLEGRNAALVRWYKLWRVARDMNGFPEEEKPAFQVPLVLWQILTKLGKEMDALLGEESEIMVKPRGQSDAPKTGKIQRWMNWRLKNLKLYKKIYVYLLQKLVFGTTIGHLYWKTKKRTIKAMEMQVVPYIVTDPMTGLEMTDPMTGQPMMGMRQEAVEVEKDVIDYDGPMFDVENLEHWLVPSYATSIDDADHFERVLWLSYEEVLDMVANGQMRELTDEEKKQLRHLAENEAPAASESGSSKQVSDEKFAQSGTQSAPQGRQNKIRFINWNGKFLVNEDDDLGQELVAFFQPDRKILSGTLRLVDMNPDGRRAFVSSHATMDINSFWGIGPAEILEPMNNEMTPIHNSALAAADASNTIVILTTPTMGQNLDAKRLGSGVNLIPTSDTESAKVLQMQGGNLAQYSTFMHQNMSFSERAVGVTEQSMGRQSETPNAPRTFGQQQLLQNENNTRTLLDVRLERENLGEILGRIWEMDKRWVAKPVFFRVTEEEPDDVMNEDDFQGDYDFELGPITMVNNKQQKTQELMMAIQMSQNIPPVYMSLYKALLNRIGYPKQAALIPDPIDMPQPKTPEEENNLLLSGQDVDPSPMDNHPVHVAKHEDLALRLQEANATAQKAGLPRSENWVTAIGRIQAHIEEHKVAMKQGAMAALAGMMGGQQIGAGQPNVLNQNQGGNGTGPTAPNQQIQAGLSSLRNSGGLNLG